MTVTVLPASGDVVSVAERAVEIRTPVPVDDLVPFLAPTSEEAESHPLTPLRSHTWFSLENYCRVVKWCAAAVKASLLHEQSTTAQQTRQFLVPAMVDCYHNDRALYAAAQLSDSSAPQRVSDIPERITRNGHVFNRETKRTLVWSRDTPYWAVDRVADIAQQALPDQFLLVKYKEITSTYDPLIYAQYGDWVVKVAEWV